MKNIQEEFLTVWHFFLRIWQRLTNAGGWIFTKNVFRQYVKSESYIDIRMHYVIMTQKIWPSLPTVWVFYRFSTKLKHKVEQSRSKCLCALQNQMEHNNKNIQTAPDYSSETAIILVIFSIKRDLFIMSVCRNSFNLWKSKKFI